MRVTRVRVENFKSLVGFDLELAKFSCLIGLNGAGKSTVLQFFDFLAQQFSGDMKTWLRQRHWKPAELNSRLSSRSNIEFTVCLEDARVPIEWWGSFNRKELRCTKERISWGGKVLLKVEDGHYFIFEYVDGKATSPARGGEIPFEYQGSIVSQLKEDHLPNPLRYVKKFFLKIHALDMLSPELLRQRTREAQGSLGVGGERLSAFLHELGKDKRMRIARRLKDVYPHLQEVEVKSLKSGWKALHVFESFAGKKLDTEARHVNDGLLRLLAIFAQLSSAEGFLLLDEIENGMNPELVEFLLDSLVETPAQVMVTTHSPLILNYLEDPVAEAGVVYLYKNEQGHTRAIRFFDIPSMKAKLRVMGPGEAYEDTLLGELYLEIRELQDG
ncbi:AAA family ATPase [Desulfoplanes sp.]